MTHARKLLIASTNRKKTAEMAQILSAADLPVEIVTLAEYPDAPEVQETGATFMENARLKATRAAAHTGLVSIADDGGLAIDALGGAPGVQSHRFLGADTSFPVKMTHIIELLKDKTDAVRTCRFHCAVVIATPDGQVFESEGTCEGQIARVMRGTYGFGYDPIFLLPQLGKHMAEIPPETKHTISHRGKALASAIVHLRRLFA